MQLHSYEIAMFSHFRVPKWDLTFFHFSLFQREPELNLQKRNHYYLFYFEIQNFKLNLLNSTNKQDNFAESFTLYFMLPITYDHPSPCIIKHESLGKRLYGHHWIARPSSCSDEFRNWSKDGPTWCNGLNPWVIHTRSSWS